VGNSAAGAALHGSSGQAAYHNAENGPRALFAWAYSIVSSRAFAVADAAGLQLACLVPVHDWMNHSPWARNCMVALHDSVEGPEHVLLATQPIPPGTEVCNSYGAGKGNADLLARYGFVVPGNLADKLPLGGPDQATPPVDVQQDIFRLDGPACQALSLLGLPMTLQGVVPALHYPLWLIITLFWTDDSASWLEVCCSDCSMPWQRAIQKPRSCSCHCTPHIFEHWGHTCRTILGDGALMGANGKVCSPAAPGCSCNICH
jgi:SET domain